MSCVLHATSQTWCRACDPDAESRNYSIIVGNPLLRETIVGSGAPSPSPSHDAQAARIAGLEANVNEKLATIAALESQLASESREVATAREARLVSCLRGVLAIVARTGGYMSPEDQQTLRDARAEVA